MNQVEQLKINSDFTSLFIMLTIIMILVLVMLIIFDWSQNFKAIKSLTKRSKVAIVVILLCIITAIKLKT